MAAHIHVAGDASVDRYFITTMPSASYNVSGLELNWKIHPLRPFQVAGSRFLLQRFIAQDIQGCDVTCTTEDTTSLKVAAPSEIVHMMAEVGRFEEKVGGRNGQTYRIRRILGFAGPNVCMPQFLRNDDVASPCVLALDDIGNGFRDDEGSWPSALKTSFSGPIILKLHRPIQSGRLWRNLTDHHLKSTIVITSCDALRSIGAHISKGLSWERTAVELESFIRKSPDFDRFRQCRAVIVRLDLDGAYLCENVATERTATLFYDPVGIEGGFKSRYAGYMRGSSAAFSAAVAVSVAANQPIGCGIKRGIIAARRLLASGFVEGDDGQFSYPTKGLFPSHDDHPPIADEEVPTNPKPQRGERWRIALAEKSIGEIAQRFVIEGRPVLEGQKIPVGVFNNLLTIDRTEIESLQAIRRLFREYIDNGSASRPHSIAVFGPPGAGKSFSVSEVAADILRERKREPLLFNLSEFTSPAELALAFHRVRDESLRGSTPLVFFDEFDSPFGQPLGWLKYFLAPMNDGKFREGETLHPIGKSIFVFAGGIYKDFQTFTKAAQDLPQSKAPDFASRLRGFVNILGPDPSESERKTGATQHTLRRAILLRSILERRAPHLIDGSGRAHVDEGIVWAFLSVSAFRHGVRSMEAIVEMSAIGGMRGYVRAALPPPDQLSLHVDGSEFLSLLQG